MISAIDLVPASVRDWLLTHGERVGRLSRLGDGASVELVRAYARLQECPDYQVPAAVRAIERRIETWEAVWGDDPE